MKFKKISLMMLMMVLVAGYSFASSGHDPEEHKSSKIEHMEKRGFSKDAIEVGNKICPVSKQPVDEMGEPVQYEYKGKIYNFCCKMCLKDFKKDPEKFSKIAEEEVAGEKEHKGSGHQEENKDHHDHGGMIIK